MRFRLVAGCPGLRANVFRALGVASARAIARAEGGTVAERLWIELVGPAPDHLRLRAPGRSLR
ncbi:hypothetical protein [Nocardia gamkensis]|uniref:hypothetical protein n=1 Tax=Nocardia gamkensis TaxID=352869 RepID=UPI0037C542DB